MATYFVDTSFWVALLNKRDADHPRAEGWRRYLSAISATLMSTHAILWETTNALAYRAARAQAAALYRRALKDPTLQLVDFTPAWTEPAIARYESRPDKDWSLTDCLSFVVMEQHGLTQALTADHHFTQAGFEPLLLKEPPSP